MARLAQPTKMSDFMSGMVSDVSETIAPVNSVALGLNLDFDKILGAAVVRPGLSQVGSQLVAGKKILGLYQHIDPSNSANNLLFAAIDTAAGGTATIKNVLTGTNVVTGLTASTDVCFLTYLGSTVAINGADAPRAWNGSSWITTGGVFDLANWPVNESSLLIEFLDRIYVNDETVPYRIHYTTVSDGSAVTWNGDYVDLEAEDQGGKLSAFAKVPGYVLFFKERSLHRWNFSSAFPESLVQIGTPSQKSVVQSGGAVFFYSNSSDDARGFYVTNGGRPQNISSDTTRTIRRFIDAISSVKESNISGFGTERVVGWSVGDLTVDGELFTNVVFRYNRVLNQWSVRSYPSEFNIFGNYTVSGVNTRIGGDDDGNVLRLDDPAAYQDVSTDIIWKLRTHNYDYGTNFQKEIVDKALVRGEQLNGVTVHAIPDGDNTRAVKLGTTNWLRKVLSLLKVEKKLNATTLSIELSGRTSGDRAVIKQIELPAIEITPNYD